MERERIEDVLFAMGIPAGIKGFNFIADAVEIIDEHGEDISVTKELYPEIAKKRNTTAVRVERAIRHGLNIARSGNGDYETVEKYIGFTNHSNFSSLVMLHKKIKQECSGANSLRQKELKTRNPEIVITESRIREIFRQELREALSELRGVTA